MSKENDTPNKKKQDTKGQSERGNPSKKAEENRKYEEYDPCPHRVWTPKPGERDKSSPRGMGSPWYIPVRKKIDVDREMEEQQEKEYQKLKERLKKRQNEMKEREKEEAEERNERMKQLKKKQQPTKYRRVRTRKYEDKSGDDTVESKTDITQELIWIMDFIFNVDEGERIKRGEMIRSRMEEMEQELENTLAKKAHAEDFKMFIKLLMEAEVKKVDKRLKKLEKMERRRRKQLLERMDPMPKQLMEEANRFKYLFNAAMGSHPEKGEGEASALEDMMVCMIVNQMQSE